MKEFFLFVKWPPSDPPRCLRRAPGIRPSTTRCTSIVSRPPTSAFTWSSKPQCSSATLPAWSWCCARGSPSTSTTNRFVGTGRRRLGSAAVQAVKLLLWFAEFHSESQAEDVLEEHTVLLWVDLWDRLQHTKGTKVCRCFYIRLSFLEFVSCGPIR